MAATRDKEPLSFEWEVVLVTGEEGAVLRLTQARAIRDFLVWINDRREVSSPDVVTTGPHPSAA